VAGPEPSGSARRLRNGGRGRKLRLRLQECAGRPKVLHGAAAVAHERELERRAPGALHGGRAVHKRREFGVPGPAREDWHVLGKGREGSGVAANRTDRVFRPSDESRSSRGHGWQRGTGQRAPPPPDALRAVDSTSLADLLRSSRAKHARISRGSLAAQ
jgi:hypothetical protein